MTAGGTGAPTRAGTREWVGLGVLVVPVLMTAVDMTVLFLAIPAIAAALVPTGTGQLWILHVGDLVGAGLVLTAGRLVDRFGPRRLLALGLAAYALASLAAALATSVAMLVVARVLLGAAAVSVAPSAMALARRMFTDGRQFATAVAVVMAAFSAGMALGPLVGGVLLENYWWGSVFLVNVPVALLTLAGLRLLPRVAGTGSGRIDLPSVALSLGGLAAVVYGGQELAAAGADGLHNIAIVVAGAALLAAFVRRQRRLTDPLLDLRLFASTPLWLALLAILLVIVADAGAELQLAQHLQVVTGLSPLHAGLALAVPAVVSVVATAGAPLLLRRSAPATVIAGGLVVAVGAAAWTVQLATRPATPLGVLLLAVSLVALGIGPVFSLGAVLVLEHAPVEQTGSAQAGQEVSGSLGNTIGLALGGSVAFVTYATTLSAGLPPGTRPDVAAASTRSIGVALEIAGREGGPFGQQLAAAATSAFAAATAGAYTVATAGFALVLVVALVLRRVCRGTGAGAAAASRT